MKRSLLIFLLATVFITCIDHELCAQDLATSYNTVTQIPDRLFKNVNDKAAKINNRLTVASARYLRQMEKQEHKICEKLSKTDSVMAKDVFGNAETQYRVFKQKLESITSHPVNFKKKYLPHLDSLQTAFKFFEKNDGFLAKDAGITAELKEVLIKLDALQNNFTHAEAIKQFILQRKQMLQDRLGKYGFNNNFKKMSQQVYYYQAQVEAYRQVFNNPSKIESSVLSMLQKTTMFRNFFTQHSQLSALFRLPAAATTNSSVSFNGLQTYNGVQQQLLQKFGSLQGMQQLQAPRAEGLQSSFNELKSNPGEIVSISNNPHMTNFKPNNQKTMSFIKRMELGANFQTVKSNYFFPATTDIALSVGYKLNDKSTVGIGGSYKIGWGSDIKHVTVSNQGMGVRSFVEYKIKANLWLTGGAELNYKSQFNKFEILNDYSPWQKSALLGISKRYRISKKLNGNMQLMYDFLTKQQVPRTQPLIFRIGYLLR